MNHEWISNMGKNYIYADPMTEWKVEEVHPQFYIAKEHE